jgi:deoxyribodipyrimidine photo-lyase
MFVVTDNRALALASDYARENDVPLIVLFTIVPGDYKAHDRSARSIDFRLRNLENIQVSASHKCVDDNID